MFTVQIDSLDPAIMSAFANLFTELAAKGSANRIEMTGKQYIDKLDIPDIGADTITLKAQPTTTAAAVFGATNLQPGDADFHPLEAAHLANAATDKNYCDNIAPPPPDPATVFGRTESPETATGVVTQEQIAAAVFAYEDPNALAASLPTASDAAAALDPAQNTAPAPVQNGAMLDSNGLPWDARIHAGTRTQTKDAVWKKKKGVDDATVAAVEAELRTVLAIPVKPFTPLNAPVAPPPPPAATVAPPPPPAATVATPPAPPAATVATPPAPPANVPPPPGVTNGDIPAASGAPTTFAELCKYITGRALPAARILEVCNRHGFAGLGLVAVRPEAIPMLYSDFATGA